jgi:hypothetical protein
MDHAKWKNIADIIWNLAATIGLVAGGLWTAYTFDALKTRNRAEREITKLQVEESELQERLKKRSAVTVGLQASCIVRPSDRQRYIDVTTTITNAGNEKAIVPFDTPPITVVRLGFDKNGTPRELERHVGDILVVGADTQVAPGILVIPGEVRSCRTLVPIERAGIYLIAFFANRPLREQNEAHEQGMPQSGRAALFASQYLVVR